MLKRLLELLMILTPLAVFAVGREFRVPEFKFDVSSVSVPNLSFPQISNDSLGTIVGVLWLGVLIASVFLYAKALSDVKMGRLIVYRDWGDFIKSSVWIILIPLGLMWMVDDSSDPVFKYLGLTAIAYGLYSIWSMFSGAFKYNSGSMCWLALFGRIAVSFLFIFALRKLHERFDDFRHGRRGVITGVLIPIAIFAWVFSALICPMVGTQYHRAWRAVRR